MLATKSDPNVNQLVKGQIVAYPYNGIPPAIKKKQTISIYQHGLISKTSGQVNEATHKVVYIYDYTFM